MDVTDWLGYGKVRKWPDSDVKECGPEVYERTLN